MNLQTKPYSRPAGYALCAVALLGLWGCLDGAHDRSEWRFAKAESPPVQRLDVEEPPEPAGDSEVDRDGFDSRDEETAAGDGQESPPSFPARECDLPDEPFPPRTSMDAGTTDADYPGEVVCGRRTDTRYYPTSGPHGGAESLADDCDVYRGTFEFAQVSYVELWEKKMVDMTFLPALRVIEGAFILASNEYLESLAGLERLERIEGSFHIDDASVLEALSALMNLQRIGGRFEVTYNRKITSFRGFDRLRSVGERLRITDNDELQSLAGLECLERVGGDVEIYGNENLSDEQIDAFLARVEVEGEIKRAP